MFKVGDKVRIRNDLEVGIMYNIRIDFSDGMVEFRGKEATVVDVDEDGDYLLDIDNREYFWCDEMLEAVKEVKTKTNIEHLLNYLHCWEVEIESNCVPIVKLEFGFPKYPFYYKDVKNIEDFKKWLLEPYKKPIRLSQFEYDCLSCCDENQRKKKFNHYDLCIKMKKKGYYKDIDIKMTIEEILNNCEVVND